MNIEQEIKDAVSKHLPQALGEALQLRLKKADEDAQSVTRLQSDIETIRRANMTLLNEVDSLKEQMHKHASLAAREAAVAKREHDADLAELRVQLEAAKGNGQFARDVAMGLVRNIEYRQAVMRAENGMVPMPGVNGGYPMTHPSSSNATTTTEATIS